MTTACPHCHEAVDVSSPPRESATCPHCLEIFGPAGTDDWVDVARVGNLAEAGFLASDLLGEGMEARVFAAESFNAVAGLWTTSYLIQVPQGDGGAAAARIREHVLEEEATPQPLLADDEGPVDPVVWRPVALMVIAGVASFLLGQRFAEPPAEVRPPPARKGLSEAVEAIAVPFYTEPLPGKPRHRLRYRSRHQAWYLDSDLDGDGRFETRQAFARD